VWCGWVNNVESGSSTGCSNLSSTFTDKQDEDLFVLDTSADKPAKAAVLSVKQKRKLNAKKPMRSHQALENTSKVQDPIAKR